MEIKIDDPKLAEDLRVLAEAGKETIDSFVARILQIAIDIAVERGKRKAGRDKAKRG